MDAKNRLSDIENACGRRITIQHEPSQVVCDSQLQSPLFSALPREIRDLIWAYATAPVEDETQRYDVNAYYCRPGHLARHKTYTALLYTCRRIWLEANAMPMLQAEQCFWYHREAPDHRNPTWMAGLTAMNRHNLGHRRLFAQFYAIEGLAATKGELRNYFLETPEEAGDFQPKMLHVTIRHTDWWYWEDEAPLTFEDSWFQAMLDSPDLRSTQTLKLELETLDYKVKQLLPIVERLRKLESKEYKTHIVNGKPAATRFVLTGEPEVSTWTGPTRIDGQSFPQYEGMESLKYHVVTLTWRLRFPEIPRAHIPTLRRAPRLSAKPQSPTGRSYHGLPREPREIRPKWKQLRRRILFASEPTLREEQEQRIAEQQEQCRLWMLSKWQDDVRLTLESRRMLCDLTQARWAAEGSTFLGFE